MRIDQSMWRHGKWSRESVNPASQLVLIFSTTALLSQESLWAKLRTRHPNAHLVAACSTAGEILDAHVFDDTVVCTSIEFERSNVAIATAQLDEGGDCAALGALLIS